MGDDIMQLARNPRAFLADPLLSEQFLLTFGSSGTFDDHRADVLAAAHALADEKGEWQEHEAGQRRMGPPIVDDNGRCREQSDDADEDDQGEMTQPSRRRNTNRGEGDADKNPVRTAEVRQVQCDLTDGHGAEDRQRGSSTPRQRNDGEDQEWDPPPQRTPDIGVMVVGEERTDGDCTDDNGDPDVPEDGVPAQPQQRMGPGHGSTLVRSANPHVRLTVDCRTIPG